MAGHSKFKNIMYRKGAQDKKRAKVFTKLIRELTVATKSGAPDPDMNPRSRSAIAAAKARNMPSDNIKRAIEKASGGGEGDNYEDVRYEGYGPGGIAVIVEALTDNRNRTAGEVRAAFANRVAEPWAKPAASPSCSTASALFDTRPGSPTPTPCSRPPWRRAPRMSKAPESHDIRCGPDDFSTVRDALEKKYGIADAAHLDWRPQNQTPVDRSTAETLFKLLDVLDDNDDVQRTLRTTTCRTTFSKVWVPRSPSAIFPEDREPLSKPNRGGHEFLGLDPDCDEQVGASSTSWTTG